MVVGARNVKSAAEAAAFEQGASLSLEGLFVEGAFSQVLIDVPSVPNEATLASAVECEPKWENAYQFGVGAFQRSAGGDAGKDSAWMASSTNAASARAEG